MMIENGFRLNKIHTHNTIIDFLSVVEDFDGVVNYEFLCNMDCKTMAMASHPEVVAKLENLADNEDLLRAMKDRCLSCYPPFAAATNQEMLAFRSSLCIAALKASFSCSFLFLIRKIAGSNPTPIDLPFA